MEFKRNIHIPVVSNFWICKCFYIFPWPLLFVLISDIKNPQTTQIIISCFFIMLDSCNGGLVINWTSLPHITVRMLESSSFTDLSKQDISRHCATSFCFCLHLSLGKIKISRCLFQLYTTVLVKKFFQKCGFDHCAF